jgi:2-keto-4-pentenoate hydratase/2-oxohepta-3-ene-1,7-dioic acid hydratase in catechol pathway
MLLTVSRKIAGAYTASMRFLSFEQGGLARPGVLAGTDTVVDLSLMGCHSLLQLIEGGDEWVVKAAKLLTSSPEDSRHKLSDVKLLAPIPKPRKLICVGLNYRDHAAETNTPIPNVPTIFNKFATAVIGPGDSIVLPKVSKMPDFEAEFAFVIGKGGRHIKAEDWRQHMFGYTIVNDVTGRDYQRATSQWLMGKTFDTFAPMGPWIVTADEIPDPHALDIQLEINGEIMQNSNTRELIFKIPELVAFLSSVFTLEPGDIVSTGTPAGVGVARTPQRFLKPNEIVTVRIPAIGELTNPTVAEV